ncbi:hypothetical protein Cni_G22792 [Canna indica]|uniref:Uncharacterized protein n=1 Tax=Canna indica TaxID=4628 RepID=A0AAQ3KYJ3_9LILI|nr:hypothetical protein Cni_G22792 [Canna indica]
MGVAVISFLFFFFLLSSTFFPNSCLSEAVHPWPHELPSFKIQEIKEEVGRSYCSYTVKIKTSCSSPRYTGDVISLAFGDAYRNELCILLSNRPGKAYVASMLEQTKPLIGSIPVFVLVLLLGLLETSQLLFDMTLLIAVVAHDALGSWFIFASSSLWNPLLKIRASP